MGAAALFLFIPSGWLCQDFQLTQKVHGLFEVVTAHRFFCVQLETHLGPLRLSEQLAAVLSVQLHAAHSGRFPTLHARYRR